MVAEDRIKRIADERIKTLEAALESAIGGEAPDGKSLRALICAAADDKRVERALRAAIAWVREDFKAEMVRE